MGVRGPRHPPSVLSSTPGAPSGEPVAVCGAGMAPLIHRLGDSPKEHTVLRGWKDSTKLIWTLGCDPMGDVSPAPQSGRIYAP